MAVREVFENKLLTVLEPKKGESSGAWRHCLYNQSVEVLWVRHRLQTEKATEFSITCIINFGGKVS
jgi:hypothetical protein